MTDNVASLFGGPKGVPEPNENAIRVLEDWLQKAKDGQIIGIGLVALWHDGMSSWAVGGRIGGYSLIGAAEIMKRDIVRLVEDEE